MQIGDALFLYFPVPSPAGMRPQFDSLAAMVRRAWGRTRCWGACSSRSDPALFSYAHGGKDGFPYPVDCPTYDRNIEILRAAVAQAKIGRNERLMALRRLAAVSRAPDRAQLSR